MGHNVCIVRDDRYLEHKTGRLHPEHPNRLKGIHRMLDKDFPRKMVYIEPKLATMEELELVHTPKYIKKVRETSEHDSTRLAAFTYTSANTFLTARLAVGGCLKALETLMSGCCKAAFALVRPPGHHAQPDQASGFCIFNNLGITARQAFKVYGLRRILVIDWDIHHGDGIQDLFYGKKELFYFSLHYLSTFPESGFAEDAGRGLGLGYNVNIPVPKELKDEDILHCYRELLGPIVRRYRPELILVAAGFDGLHRDPLGQTRLTEQAFGWLTHMIMDLRAEVGGPPVLFALEGGYDIKSLVSSTREVLMALTAGGHQAEIPQSYTPLGAELVAKAGQVHAKYGVWIDAIPEQQTRNSPRM